MAEVFKKWSVGNFLRKALNSSEKQKKSEKSYYGYYYCETLEKVNELYWAVMNFKSSEMREHEMVHNMNVWVIEQLSVGVIGKKKQQRQ